MSLPNKISVQTLAGVKDNPYNYESHFRTIQAVNNLIASLGPGTAIKPQNFTVSPGFGTNAVISAVSGTFKRGSFTVTAGSAGFAANPSVFLNFPSGTFTNPFAIVVRNGGTGSLPFTYTQSKTGVAITFQGTPTAGQTFGFQFDVRD